MSTPSRDRRALARSRKTPYRDTTMDGIHSDFACSPASLLQLLPLRQTAPSVHFSVPTGVASLPQSPGPLVCGLWSVACLTDANRCLFPTALVLREVCFSNDRSFDGNFVRVTLLTPPPASLLPPAAVPSPSSPPSLPSLPSSLLSGGYWVTPPPLQKAPSPRPARPSSLSPSASSRPSR